MRWPVEDTEASPVYIAPMTRARAGPTGPWIFGVPVSIAASVLADLRTHLGMVTPNPEPATIRTARPLAATKMGMGNCDRDSWGQ